MYSASTHAHAGYFKEQPSDHVELAHDARHLRRRMLELASGETLLVDLPQAVVFADGDFLVTDNGRYIEVRAALEPLYEIRARNPLHFSELCWHLGNRHLSAQIDGARILILRDHVIKSMLESLGASVRDAVERFQPLRGAYHGGHSRVSHGHDHHHDHHHG